MPTTSQGLYKPDSSTGAELVPVLTNMQDSVDAVLKKRTAPYADIAARDVAIPIPADGDMAWTTDYDVEWRYNGTKWRVNNVPEFPSTSVRDAIITSPSANDRCRVGSGSTWTEYTYTGSAWSDGSMVGYTPTVANLTNGSGGTITAFAGRDGKMVDAQGQFVFGTGSAVGTVPTFSLPYAAARHASGSLWIVDSGTRGYAGICTVSATQSVVKFVLPTAIDYISASNPMVWTSGDYFTWTIRYEAA